MNIVPDIYIYIYFKISEFDLIGRKKIRKAAILFIIWVDFLIFC